MSASVKVRVPATVANLGPGFDALGVAIRMHLEIDIEPRRDSVEIMVEGEGAEQLPADDTNLVVHSMNMFFDHVGRRPSGYAVRVQEPHSTGCRPRFFGRRSGRWHHRWRARLTNRTVSQIETMHLANELEGHPDNILPALLGGLVVCYKSSEGGELRHYRTEPSDRLVPIVAVPREGYSTTEARKALPSDVAFSDAQFTASQRCTSGRCHDSWAAGGRACGGNERPVARAPPIEAHARNLRRPLRAPQGRTRGGARRSGTLAACGRPAPRDQDPRRTGAESLPRPRGGWRVFVSEWELSGATTIP